MAAVGILYAALYGFAAFAWLIVIFAVLITVYCWKQQVDSESAKDEYLESQCRGILEDLDGSAEGSELPPEPGHGSQGTSHQS